MTRTTLDPTRLHPAIAEEVEHFGADIIYNVQAATQANLVLVVGMAGNPFCRRVRRVLDDAGITHHYLEYGSYFGQWRRRLALKMWAGWPTFPMVFVRGSFVGGCQDVQRLVASGELKRLLGEP